MAFQRKRENDGLAGKVYNNNKNEIFIENEVFSGCFHLFVAPTVGEHL